MKITTSHNRSEAPAFSFVVVADTHVNEADGVSTSPFETNHLANERARYVFHEIASMAEPPEFVIHLGDIVHPVPGLPTFDDAVGLFKEIAAPLTVPLHVIPGNHDIGDKRINWMPADQICDEYVDKYREAFGADYYSFTQGPIRFVMLNSLLLNSGLPDEAKQQQWLESEISQNPNERVFVFMHYPPYIYSPDERGNYDNIDMPKRYSQATFITTGMTRSATPSFTCCRPPLFSGTISLSSTRLRPLQNLREVTSSDSGISR